MKNKRSKIFERIFFSLVILSVLLLVGCAMVQKIISPSAPPRTETSQGDLTPPNPSPEKAAVNGPGTSPQPGQIAEENHQGRSFAGNQGRPETEQLSVGTPEDPIAAGRSF